jgi:hypothetical protein
MQASEQYADNDGVCEKGEGCVIKQLSWNECMGKCHSGSQGTGLPGKKSDDDGGEDNNNDKDSGNGSSQNTGPNSGYPHSIQTPPIPAGPVTLTFTGSVSIYTNKPSNTVIYPNQLQIGPLTAGGSVNWRSDIGHHKFFGIGFDITNPGYTANAGYTVNLGKVNADLDIGIKVEFRKDLLIDSLAAADILITGYLLSRIRLPNIPDIKPIPVLD